MYEVSNDTRILFEMVSLFFKSNIFGTHPLARFGFTVMIVGSSFSSSPSWSQSRLS